MAENVVVSYEGLNEASQSLLSCASDLSDLFDSIAQVTVSIGSNVTGFSSIEDFVSKLEKINSTKDSLISKIKEFANYLPTVVASGYDAFAEAIGNIDIDLSSLSTLIAMLSGTTLGGSGTTEGSSDESTSNYGGYGGDNMGVVPSGPKKKPDNIEVVDGGEDGEVDDSSSGESGNVEFRSAYTYDGYVSGDSGTSDGTITVKEELNKQDDKGEKPQIEVRWG